MALLLSGLLLSILGCALPLHEPSDAHGVPRAVSAAQQGVEQLPHAAAPADSSCSPAGADTAVVAGQQTRTPTSAAPAPEATTGCPPSPDAGLRRAQVAAPGTSSGRSTLCSLCRWRR